MKIKNHLKEIDAFSIMIFQFEFKFLTMVDPRE